ncbi:MAG: ubiquitin [Firmicutes bacterium]|nr:ubiquitin [Bacillota bacterium]
MEMLDQIERLREKANVTYEEAKNALEAANGDLLDALILLERQGKVQPPSGDGYYSSARDREGAGQSHSGPESIQSSRGEGLGYVFDRIGKFLVGLVDKGNRINLEVFKDGGSKVRCPLTVLVLLLIFAPWIVIPLVVIGLVLNYKFQFNESNASNGADASDRA